jgi:hypothetical protein
MLIAVLIHMLITQGPAADIALNSIHDHWGAVVAAIVFLLAATFILFRRYVRNVRREAHQTRSTSRRMWSKRNSKCPTRPAENDLGNSPG